MLTKVSIVMFGLSALIIVGAEDPLCTLYGEPHTLCRKAKNCLVDSNGGACGVNDRYKHEILAFHNNYRQKVANGLETDGSPGPQPAGTNIRELTWNDDLARAAQRWAEQKVDGKDNASSRLVPGFDSVGQNLYVTLSGQPMISKPNWWWAIKQWYDEVYNMRSDLTGVPDKVVGKYTQLVWADTYEIGCGVFTDDTKCSWIPDTENYFCTKYVCNYGPAGNKKKLDGSMEPPYSTTEGCKTPSTNYPGLCSA